ncbi:hypothetical protein [Austwickia chelonae]|uniref:hypothetical protein n=1 Tax=Austwickia chelonae TaxID=100225 RepID=UPI000E287099|nr:hypothetical protein [Austwickia chelonae]
MPHRELQDRLSPVSAECCALIPMPTAEQVRRRGDRRRAARGTAACLAAVLVTAGGFGLLGGPGGRGDARSEGGGPSSSGMSTAAAPVPAYGKLRPEVGGVMPTEEPARRISSVSVDPVTRVRVAGVADGVFGHRVGTVSGGFDHGAGVLPYTSRVATTTLSGSAPEIGSDLVSAIGVDSGGHFHLTLRRSGRAVEDAVLPLSGGAEVSALLTTAEGGTGQVSVLVFVRSGGVRRVVLEGVGPGSTPRVSSDEIVAADVPEVTAVVLADEQAVRGTRGKALTVYAVSGDRLVLLTVPPEGKVSSFPLALKGLEGTTALGLLDGRGQAVHGIVAWKGVGPGVLFLGRAASGPFTETGEAGALHH